MAPELQRLAESLDDLSRGFPLSICVFRAQENTLMAAEDAEQIANGGWNHKNSQWGFSIFRQKMRVTDEQIQIEKRTVCATSFVENEYRTVKKMLYQMRLRLSKDQ